MFSERRDMAAAKAFFRSAKRVTGIIALVVLWRLRYKLSLRDLPEMFARRGMVFSHETVREWEPSLPRRWRRIFGDAVAAKPAVTSDGYWARFSTVPERSLNCFPHWRQRNRR